MKTLRLTTGEIVRVKDSIATTIVKVGGGLYVPKSEWKSGRDGVSSKPDDNPRKHKVKQEVR